MLDFVTTSSYVDPTGFPHSGKFFLLPQNKPCVGIKVEKLWTIDMRKLLDGCEGLRADAFFLWKTLSATPRP